jgi:hypothetical protein
VIVRAVTALSRELGMATTAEGVETHEQLISLALAGCTHVQGYLFSRPVPQNAVAALLRSMPTIADLLGDDLPGDDLPGDNLPGDDLPGDNLPGQELRGGELPGEDGREENVPAKTIRPDDAAARTLEPAV